MEACFRSKVDVWLGAVLIASAAVALLAACVILMEGSFADFWLAVFLALVGAVLPVWVLADTRYVIGQHVLLIRSGPFRWRIPLQQIRSIEPTRSPLSSPALSLDRLRIEYGVGRACMVSPVDRQGFIAAIQDRSRAPA